ncbi:8739_t:CDS:1, partial [Diversispora eburnea]
WRKDPSDQTLIKTYQAFYNSVSNSVKNTNSVESNEISEDYQYLSNRLWHKL